MASKASVSGGVLEELNTYMHDIQTGTAKLSSTGDLKRIIGMAFSKTNDKEQFCQQLLVSF